MTETITANEIAPLADRDIEAAADGRSIDADELRDAVATISSEIDDWAGEMADALVPEDHGKYGEPLVITESEDYVCIYAEFGALAQMTEDALGQTVPEVGHAHNEYARRHGADPDVLGTMDAVVLPRTETVEQIITERE